MSTEMFTSLKDFFSAVWGFFQLQVPGFNFSFGALALALLLIDFSLRIVSFICGFGFGGLSGIGSFIHGAKNEVSGGNSAKVYKQSYTGQYESYMRNAPGGTHYY